MSTRTMDGPDDEIALFGQKSIEFLKNVIVKRILIIQS